MTLDFHRLASEVAAILAVIGSWMGYLPLVAAGLACAWYCVLLYDRFKGGRPGQDGP